MRVGGGGEGATERHGGGKEGTEEGGRLLKSLSLVCECVTVGNGSGERERGREGGCCRPSRRPDKSLSPVCE